MGLCRLACGLGLLGLLVLGGSPDVADAEDLDLAAPVPFDPDIKIRATLPNGMRYWIRQHKKPRGAVSLVLNVASGSVQETKEQRGLAHFIEHMAFNGSKHFPPGTVIPYFSSLGIPFGSHQNASTSFSCTEYSVDMPSYTEATFERALCFLSDAARDIRFDAEEVEKEKPVVLEEFRYRGGMRGRLWAKQAPLLLKGSRYAFRMPIGKKDRVSAATPEILRAYHDTWYRPERTTLVVVGDIDPAEAERAIKKAFEGWEKPDAPPPKLRMGRLIARGLRVGVFDDPDEHHARVTITHTRRTPPRKTYADLRRRLIEDLGVRLMNARFQYLHRSKGALFSHASMYLSSLVPGVEMIECSAAGRKGTWISLMREIVHEIERVNRDGFTPDELMVVRSNLLARYDDASKSSSSDIASSLQATLARKQDPVGTETWERVGRALLPKITARDVTHAFRALFDLDNVAIVLSLPEEKDALQLPNEPEVLEYYKEAREDKLRTWSQRNAKLRVDSILAEDPEPGEIASRTEEKGLGVTSLVMKNGIRVHLKKHDRTGRVYVRVNFLGGQIEETEENRGVTDVAFGSLDSDGIATKDTNPDMVTRYLSTRQTDLACRFDESMIRYDVWGTKKDLADGMRLLWLVLTQPYVHYEATRTARRRWYGWHWGTKRDAGEMADHLIGWHMSGSDPRWRMPSWEEYEKATDEKALAWMKRIVETAPMEVAIVGAIDAKEGEALACRWFGSLPKRPDRLKKLNELRRVKAWTGPVREQQDVESNDPSAVVELAWRGPGRENERERVALDHAATVIDARLFGEVREEQGLCYAVSAWYASEDVDGMDRLSIHITTGPEKAKRAVAIAREVVLRLVKEGPTKSELEAAERQWRTHVDEADRRPSHWLRLLTRLHFDGRTLEDVKARLADRTKADGALIKEALAKVVKDANYIEVVSLPKPPK
jgi:zinc protease